MSNKKSTSNTFGGLDQNQRRARAKSKKTSIGSSPNTKAYSKTNKKYKKPYRGQGK